MDIDQCFPGDRVYWHRVQNGTAYTGQIIPAQIVRRTKEKVVIKVTDPAGYETLRHVTPVQLVIRLEHGEE